MKFEKFSAHFVPVNSTAARVLYGKGQAWDVKRKQTENETFDAPPLPAMQMPVDSKDYSGLRRGRMVAFRFHGGKPGDRTWLARCDCGRYEIRRIVRWVKKMDAPDACGICRAEHYVKHGVSLGDARTRHDREREIRAAMSNATDLSGSGSA